MLDIFRCIDNVVKKQMSHTDTSVDPSHHNNTAQRQSQKEHRRQISWIRIASIFFLVNAIVIAIVLVVERKSFVFEIKHTIVGVFGVSSIVLLFILSCCGFSNERAHLIALIGLCVAFYLIGIGTDSIAQRIGHAISNAHH